MSMDSEDEIQVDGFDDVKHTPVVLKNLFFPWHKPRKQYIRLEQWNSAAASLIQALNLSDGRRSLEYLSLPGPDLLDVRALYSVCEAAGVKLKFTGLNHIPPEKKALLSDQLISLDELRNRDFIDNASDVYPDKLENLSKKDSIAYQRVIKLAGTYDVINIDLCDSFLGAPPQDKQENYYNSLFELLRYQADNRNEDWLFFITSRTNSDMVDPKTFLRFIEVLESVFEVDDDLYNHIVDSGIFSAVFFNGKKLSRPPLDSKTFGNVVATGIGKWVFSSLVENLPAHRSKMLKLFSYNVSVEEGHCDMISLGFWCKKNPSPARDPLGLAKGVIPAGDSIDVLKSKGLKQIVDSVTSAIDIDKLLCQKGLFEQYLHLSAELMRSARYDPQAYMKWATAEHEQVAQAISQR